MNLINLLTSELGSPLMRPLRLCSKKLALFSSPSVNEEHKNNQGSTVGRLELKFFLTKLNIYLAQHAQGHVDGGQQGSKRRSHIGVERRSCEAEHKQGSILGQIHTLTHRQRHKSAFYSVWCMKVNMWHKFLWCCWKYEPIMSIKANKQTDFGEKGAHQSRVSRLTWSRSIWQQSGVKCWRVARVLLRIFRRLHCTASRAFCSASSLSPPPAASLDGVWGGRCVLGRGPGGNASPFLAWRNQKQN